MDEYEYEYDDEYGDEYDAGYSAGYEAGLRDANPLHVALGRLRRIKSRLVHALKIRFDRKYREMWDEIPF